MSDELGRVVYKLEIKWAADFDHSIVVTSELRNVRIYKSNKFGTLISIKRSHERP